MFHDEVWISIVLAAVCVVVSAFCSGTEVALFSLRRVDREQLAKSTSATDRLIVRLLERPRRLIATVLIGNEACTALLAVIALGFTCRTCESALAAFGLALAITLPLVVLVTEVTAKTLAAKAPLGWARVCSGPLALFAHAVTPVRLVIAVASEVILRPLGQGARTRPARDLSEEEFRHLVDAGSAQGQVDARERRLIHRVFEFSDKNVGQVMTPRDRIFAVSMDLPTTRLVKDVASRGFSRVPVYQKSLDNIRGVLNAKDLVGVPVGRRDRSLGQMLHDPLFVPRTTPVKRLFLTFKQKKVHMAIVVSEYGKVLGLVTMDDLLSQIFGVLRDERAALQSRVRTPAQGSPAGVVPARDPDTGPVPRESAASLDESRPVPREVLDEVSRPITDPGLAMVGEAASPVVQPGDVETMDEASVEAPLDGDANASGPTFGEISEEDPNATGHELPPPPGLDEPDPDDDAASAVDVDLIAAALGAVTDRQMAGLPRAVPPTIPPISMPGAEEPEVGELTRSGRHRALPGDRKGES